MTPSGGGSDSTEPNTARGSSGPSPELVPISSLQFTEACRRCNSALRARGLPTCAFRSPPATPGVDRTLRRYEGGTIVAVRIRGRDRADVLHDLIAGAITAALGDVDEALVAELLLEVDPPEQKPEPVDWSHASEEPF